MCDNQAYLNLTLNLPTPNKSPIGKATRIFRIVYWSDGLYQISFNLVTTLLLVEVIIQPY